MNWFLILGFAAVAFLVGCAVGGALGWLDRHASVTTVPADELAPSNEIKAA